jgi:hypothetical protein
VVLRNMFLREKKSGVYLLVVVRQSATADLKVCH